MKGRKEKELLPVVFTHTDPKQPGRILRTCPHCGDVRGIGNYAAAHLGDRLTGTCPACDKQHALREGPSQ